MLFQKDLQIHNWVLYKPENQYLIVERKNGDSVILRDYEDFPVKHSISNLEGIELNSNNLSVCGFREKFENKMVHTEIAGLSLERVSSNIWHVQFNNNAVPVSYVHELQNASFALTQKKITVNLFGIK